MAGKNKVLNGKSGPEVKKAKRKAKPIVDWTFRAPAIRRLARRGGIKRVSYDLYEETRRVIENYVIHTLRNAQHVMESSGRKMIDVHDILYALRVQGRTVYGFDARMVKK